MLRGPIAYAVNLVAMLSMLLVGGCSAVDVPDGRNVNIPSPTAADSRKQAINERPDSVMYLPLGEDVLVPEVMDDNEFPHEMVGPFELRGETLAGALQLILADYDISIAFETQEGLTRRITVANLKGDIGKVVHQVCALANLYCSYEDGTVTVKDTQTFTVTLPPLGSSEDAGDYLTDISAGLAAILGSGSSPIVDGTTRTIVYTATQRTANIATRYFQRLRANTAMIVFETYIWEVSLNSGNSVGIDWTQLASFGKFNTGLALDGSVGADFTSPISIGLPTTGREFDGETGDLIEFLSQFGAVKTISQPQITVLSGSEAELRVADTRNYVSQIATTLDQGQSTTSVNTDSVDTGFTLTINSSWDKSTVYANVAIELTDVKQIDDFAFADEGEDGSRTVIQLPQTSERQLTTQIRVRPGDSVLIAGLVRENDNYDDEGLGFMKPIIPKSRTAQTENLELVILLRPRVVVYTAPNDQRYLDFAMKKHKLPGAENSEHPAVGNADAEQSLAPMPADSTSSLAPAPATPVAPVTKAVLPPPSSPAPVPTSKPVSPEAPTPIVPQTNSENAPPVGPASASGQPAPVLKPVVSAEMEQDLPSPVASKGLMMPPPSKPVMSSVSKPAPSAPPAPKQPANVPLATAEPVKLLPPVTKAAAVIDGKLVEGGAVSLASIKPAGGDVATNAPVQLIPAVVKTPSVSQGRLVEQAPESDYEVYDDFSLE